MLQKELLSERIISLTQDKVDLSSEVSDLKYKIFELTKQLSKVETKVCHMLMSSCDTLTSISCVMRNRTFVLMCMF